PPMQPAWGMALRGQAVGSIITHAEADDYRSLEACHQRSFENNFTGLCSHALCLFDCPKSQTLLVRATVPLRGLSLSSARVIVPAHFFARRSFDSYPSLKANLSSPPPSPPSLSLTPTARRTVGVNGESSPLTGIERAIKHLWARDSAERNLTKTLMPLHPNDMHIHNDLPSWLQDAHPSLV
ncbi:hypothetical protein KUCAC02_006385, partial [Chaenocephalus aceratus]